MTGTSRLLTLTATAVIALGAASGPSLAGQDRGKGQTYGQGLVKQVKQAKQAKQAKRAPQGKQAKRAPQGKPGLQAMLHQPPKYAKPGQGRPGQGMKHRQQAGFVKLPTHGKSPKPVRSPAPVRPVVLPVKPPKHGKQAPRYEKPWKHAVYTPPRPIVMPDYGNKRDEKPRYKSQKDTGHGGYAPPRPIVKPDYGHKRDDKHRHESHKYAGHGGYAPPRPIVLPERHYHNHQQRVVVHEHYYEDRSHYHDHDGGSYLLPLVAFGVTAAVLASQADYGAAPAYPAYQEEVTFTTPRAPVAQPAVYAPPIETAGPPSTCLMTREYQTQVTVGGQLVPAYGQACLQPDGSWYHGPAVPETY